MPAIVRELSVCPRFLQKYKLRPVLYTRSVRSDLYQAILVIEDERHDLIVVICYVRVRFFDVVVHNSSRDLILFLRAKGHV